MFYKVVVEEEEPQTSCFPLLSLSLEVLAKVIKEYIQIILIQMMLIPVIILHFYFYFTDRHPLGDDLKLLRLSRAISIVVFMVLYFSLALIK